MLCSFCTGYSFCFPYTGYHAVKGACEGQLTMDVVLTRFVYMADKNWTEWHDLQYQGIEVAKADGKHLGRSRVEYL